MRWKSALSSLFVMAAVGLPLQAGIIVRFDQIHYDVSQNQVLEVDVVLDADDSVGGNQVLPNDLFSMAFEVIFNSSIVDVSGSDQVDLPAALNTDGLGGSPVITAGTGLSSVRVVAAAPIAQLYNGELGGDGVTRQMRLATISMSTQGLGDFTLGLGFIPSRTLESFLDGTPSVLDSDISFESSTVSVFVPEPTSSVVFVVLGSVWFARRRGGASGARKHRLNVHQAGC
jgi:hypothetical protein